MNNQNKEKVKMMQLEAQKTLDIITKLIEENPDLPQEVKNKAFKEIKKTGKEINKITSI